jgi:hypothetical protein
MLRGTFIAISAYIKKTRDLSSKQLNDAPQVLEKQEQTNSKTAHTEK